MKTLLLLRHAKSSWDDLAVADHDRPLKRRGIKAARRTGRRIRRQRLHPQLVVCSTALRARETLGLVLEEAELRPNVEFSERLYHCAPEEFAGILQGIGPEISTVMLVGHNPGLEDFLGRLTGQAQSFPTAALAQIEFDLADWSQFTAATPARLVNIWRPREESSDE